MSEPLTALLVEDSVDDAELLVYELEQAGFKLRWTRVETEPAFCTHLGPHLDVVLTDFKLPRFSTPRALALLRERRLDVPLIIVSGTIGEERAVEMMKSGATDYVLKGNLQRLPAVIRRALAETREKAERRRVEHQLRVHTSALEAAASGILITDDRGTILFANDAMCAMSGFTREELVGTTPRVLKSGAHDDEFYRVLWNSILAGRVWQGRMTNRRKDGSVYHEEMTITPVQGADGTATHFIAVKQDVTERRKLEEQLRQAQKMESIGLLAGGVAHDFNNLLTIIQGRASLLQAVTTLSDEVRESAEEISLAAERAAGLTRQLLAFSRRQVLQPKHLDLNLVLAEVTKLLGRLVGANISVHLRTCPGLNLVHADQGMIEQVLMNLAVNARDAMPRGGTLLVALSNERIDDAYVIAHPHAMAGAFVCLSVSDTGCGIAPETLPRIFEPFFTTKAVGKGTGLGLGTVYGIVQQHHGWIGVYSEVGKGTVMRIYLPAVPGRVSSGDTTVSRKEVRGGSETVLLVEDEPSLLALGRSVLERFGYTVLDADTGARALEVWREHGQGIALVVTDIIMPDRMTGLELAQQLKQMCPGLPVIFTSGYSAEIVGKDHGLVEGVNFLQKPYHILNLARAVRRALDRVAAGPAQPPS